MFVDICDDRYAMEPRISLHKPLIVRKRTYSLLSRMLLIYRPVQIFHYFCDSDNLLTPKIVEKKEILHFFDNLPTESSRKTNMPRTSTFTWNQMENFYVQVIERNN